MILSINLEYVVCKSTCTNTTKNIYFISNFIHWMAMNFIKCCSVKFECWPLYVFNLMFLISFSLTFCWLNWNYVVVCPKAIFCTRITDIMHKFITWFKNILINSSNNNNKFLIRFKFKHHMVFPNFREWYKSSH